MLTQKHLISGLPADQRDDLGERFVAALAAKHPALGVQEMAATATAANGAATGGSAGVARRHAGKQPGGVRKRPRLWEKLKEGVSSGDRAAVNGTGLGVCAVVGGKDGVGDGGGTGRGADFGGSGGGFSFGFSF